MKTSIVKDMWIAVMNKTCDSLESVKEEVSLDLKRKSVSKECFFAGIINTYTNEATYLYTDLNTALRRQTLGYCPASDDLALGPYIVIYQLLLLFWDELEKESQQTYRRMILCDKDVAKYKKGVKFSWQCFVSSTIDKHCATPFPTRAPLKRRS
ncbi:unnamed protein product [Mytilus edulis]|uniref:Uncharacterized protein n=1 Tax=Mytilus edulis TaxID=6550 RepID=A0A8S3T7H2_MYTED|nr:unnamed protein product [Mytilus edulis]